MQDDLATRLLAGDRRALARGISLVEDDRPEGWELVREIFPHTGKAQIVGASIFQSAAGNGGKKFSSSASMEVFPQTPQLEVV